MKRVSRPVRVLGVLSVLLLWFSPGLGAAVKSFVRDFSYAANDLDTEASARLIAFERAKKVLCEDVSVYLEDHTEVRYFRLSGGEIRALVPGMVAVEKIAENWNGRVLDLRAGIHADVLKTVRALDALRRDRSRAERFIKAGKKTGEALLNVERFGKVPPALKTDAVRTDRYHQAVRDLAAAGWLVKGLSADLAGRDAEAVDAFTRAIELTPGDKTLYAERASANERMKRDDRALEDYGKILSLDPADAAAYLSRGNLEIRLGRPEEALSDYDRAEVIRPGDGEIWYRRGLARQTMGRFAEAVRDYHRALEINPRHAEARKNLDLCYRKTGSRDVDTAYFDAVISRSPGHAAACLGRGTGYWKLGQNEKALEDFDRVIGLTPRDTKVYLWRGIVRGTLGNVEGAIDDYGTVLELDLLNAISFGPRVRAYGDQSIQEQAERDLRAAAGISAKDASGLIYRGIARLETGRYEQAVQDFQAASKMGPRNARANLFLGIAHGRLGNFEQAARYSGRAIELDSACAAAYAVRGTAYDNLNRKRQSLEDLKTAARLGHRGARDLLKSKGYK